MAQVNHVAYVAGQQKITLIFLDKCNPLDYFLTNDNSCRTPWIHPPVKETVGRE
jgi:hypothetical protein